MSRFVNKQVVSVCAAAAMTCAVGATLLAQRAPQTKAEVAKPGGKIPNAPKLALVKVAESATSRATIEPSGEPCSARSTAS